MHTIPKHLGEFTALAQGKTDYTVQVIHTNPESYGDLMTICATEEAVYITREQAKAFFGLVEPLPFNAELCGGTSATNAVLNGKT